MKLNMSFGNRLVVLVCAFIVGLFVASAVPQVGLFGRRADLWISTELQDVLVFVLPALLVACMGGKSVAQSLRLDVGLSWRQVAFVTVVYVVSLPALNWGYDLNRSMSLPDSMSSLEHFMRLSEEAAQQMTDELLSSTSFAAMLCSLFVVALSAAFAEEMFFRGAILGLCVDCGMRRHLAIWTVAFVFSFIHFQFFGFLPRLLLGAWLGYLMVWSRSLWLPILAHTLNNGCVVVTTYLSNVHLIDAGLIDSVGIPQAGQFPVVALVSAVLTALAIGLCRKFAEPVSAS